MTPHPQDTPTAPLTGWVTTLVAVAAHATGRRRRAAREARDDQYLAGLGLTIDEHANI